MRLGLFPRVVSSLEDAMTTIAQAFASITPELQLPAAPFTNILGRTDLEGFEFRFCLPGPRGYEAYRNLTTGEIRFFRRTELGFVELGALSSVT